MGWGNAIVAVFAFISRVWDYMSGRKKRELEKRREQLVDESVQAQIKGDLNELRRIRHELEDVDAQLVPFS